MKQYFLVLLAFTLFTGLQSCAGEEITVSVLGPATAPDDFIVVGEDLYNQGKMFTALTPCYDTLTVALINDEVYEHDSFPFDINVHRPIAAEFYGTWKE